MARNSSTRRFVSHVIRRDPGARLANRSPAENAVQCRRPCRRTGTVAGGGWWPAVLAACDALTVAVPRLVNAGYPLGRPWLPGAGQRDSTHCRTICSGRWAADGKRGKAMDIELDADVTGDDTI